nr:MAG TPA: hypothetical protein [Caudoviricetes sp.]
MRCLSTFDLLIYSSVVYYFPTSFHFHVLESSSPKNQFVKLVAQALSKSSA